MSDRDVCDICGEEVDAGTMQFDDADGKLLCEKCFLKRHPEIGDE